MNTHADKTQQNKSQSGANGVSIKQGGVGSTFLFTDDRNEVVAQRKLQEMANNSQQVKQLMALQEMANNRTQAKQAVQLQSNGYAPGTDIPISSEQEKHLPYETGQVMHQKQGRVKPALQMKTGVNVNDDEVLEHEADVMGAKAAQIDTQGSVSTVFNSTDSSESIQLKSAQTQVAQRIRIINDDGYRLANESDSKGIVNTEELSSVELEVLIFTLVKEGKGDLVNQIYEEKESGQDKGGGSKGTEPNLEELLALGEEIAELKKKGSSGFEESDHVKIKEIIGTLQKAQAYVSKNSDNISSTLIRDTLVSLNRELKEATGEGSGSDEPVYDLMITTEARTAYRDEIREMGTYASLGEGNHLANYMHMQVPVFIIVNGNFVHIDTLGPAQSLVGTWGLIHLGNHYEAVEGAANGQAVGTQTKWINTAKSGDCLFESLLVVRHRGKVGEDVLNKIGNLRNEVAGNMLDGDIDSNLQEMILFGNVGRAGKKTKELVGKRRREAASKSSKLARIKNVDRAKIQGALEKLVGFEDLVNFNIDELKERYLEERAKSDSSEETLTAFDALNSALGNANQAYMKQKGNAELGYNEEDVNPFLVKKGRLVHAELKMSRMDPTKDNITMYHMTSFKNLISIQENGLDPNFGAKVGGSCSIGRGVELQKSSKKNTKGKIAAGVSNQVVGVYVHQRGAWAELVQDSPIANFEIMLKFESGVAKDWVVDPDHPNGAWHSKTQIPADKIEGLLFDGWHPIKDIDTMDLLGEDIYPQDGPDQAVTYLAYQLDDLIATFPEMDVLKNKKDPKDPTEILNLMEEDRFKYLFHGKYEFRLRGTTAHPISEPQEWLFVLSVENLDKNDLETYSDAIGLYTENIGDQGWGK